MGTLAVGVAATTFADDCNQNGVPDKQDIANGTSEDRNGAVIDPYGLDCIEVGNGIPDECEAGVTISLQPEPGPYANDFALMHEAVCMAVDGWIVELQAGIYWLDEAIDFGTAGVALGDKAIELRSVAGPESTILDARTFGGAGSDIAPTVVSAIGGDLTDDLRPKIEGFTIRFGNGGLPLPGTGMPAGGGILLIDSDAIIENCIIELNYAGGGAAIAVKGGAPIIRNCIIRNNFASGPGAGILLIDSDAIIENCVIEGNIASGRGGGIYAIGGRPTIDGTLVDFNDSASQGGGIAWMGSSVAGGRLLVDDCVVQENLAVAGGGIWIKPGVSNLELRDTSLCGNEPEQIVGAYDDLGGNGGCGIGCPADLTGDAQVNGADLTVILSSWGPLGGAADLNGDGVVDGADLTALLAAWGSCE